MKKEQTETTVVGSKGKLGAIVIEGKAHSVISIMRKMGYVGFTQAELLEVLQAHVGDGNFNLLPAEHTMKLALKRGRDEAKGIDTGRKMADVTEKALREWAGVQKAKKVKGSKKKGKKADDTLVAPEQHEKDGLTEQEVVEAAA